MTHRIIALLPSLLLSLPLTAMAARPVWIDVSSPEEYRQEHLADAVHIPHTRIAQGVTARYPDKNTPLNLYDRGDDRAALASEALQILGYRQVMDKGGLEALKARGLVTWQAEPQPDAAQPDTVGIAPAQ